MITIVAQMDAYEQSSNKYQVGTDNNKKEKKKKKKQSGICELHDYRGLISFIKYNKSKSEIRNLNSSENYEPAF